MLGVGTSPAPAASPVEAASRVPPPASSEPTPEERDAWAVLAAVDGLGPVGFAALLGRYQTAVAILEDAARPGALARLLAVPPLDDDRPHRSTRMPITRDVAPAILDGIQRGPAILARLRSMGIQVVTLEERAYPRRLGEVALPPHVLFVTGRVEAIAAERSVAIVGTRHATGSGRAVAAKLARALADVGAVVVSGLAYGIDGAAHEATLRAEGTTVAVIGGGHAHVGPPGHRRLAEAIVSRGGAIASEHAPDIRPTQGTFPRRNRIISGLSEATVVVEAPARSGALITASWALEQGRPCFVVPGPIDAPASAGCLALLREYGHLVRIVAGIPQCLADLGYATGTAPQGPRAAPSDAVAAAAFATLGTTEQAVVSTLGAGHRTVDEVVAVLDLPVATVLATLALLERRGLVVGRHGRYRIDGDLLGTPALPATR